MKWFSNRKMSVKLLLGFSVVMAVAVAVGVIGIINLDSVSSNDALLYTNMTVPIGDLTEIATSFQQMRVNLRELILLTDPAAIASVQKEITDRRAELDQEQEDFSKTILSDEVQQAYNAYLQARVDFGSFFDQIEQLTDANKDTEAFALLESDAVNKAEMAEQNAILNLVSLKDKDAAAKSAGNNSMAQTARITVLCSLVGGLILTLLLALFISRSISGSMKKIILAAEQIADGDLSANVDISSKDEIGELASTFRRMTKNLNEVMSGINAASEQVSMGAKELSDSSVSLSQGASEQASSIEEVTASLEEISSQTKQNAENASEANKLAGVARDNAMQGNQQMKEMLKAMEDINESSGSISKIIKVIDDIAFQTNILALNAAVEAARAGEHGRGFAVVAEEVRNLAVKSANAAKETTDMIESSIRKVEAGTKLATHTAEDLENIVDDVAQAATLVNQIDVASKEQAIGLSQINQAVIQVSQVVQANSAVSEQSAAASKELASQAESMRETVGKFTLKKDPSAKPRTVAAEARAEESAKPLPVEHRPAKSPEKRTIALSDDEFGKY